MTGLIQKAKRLACALALLAVLSGCGTTTTNTTAATIETSAQVAIASAAGYMALKACSETVGSPCGVKETAKKVDDAQLALEATMKTYRASVAAYKAAMNEQTAATVSAARIAAYTALESLNSILALDSVKSQLEVR